MATALLVPAVTSLVSTYAKAKMKSYKPQERPLQQAAVQSKPDAPLVLNHVNLRGGADNWDRRAMHVQSGGNANKRRDQSRREMPKSWLRVIPETYHDKVNYKALEKAHLLRSLQSETFDGDDPMYIMPTNPRATLPGRVARPNKRPFKPGT